jgi:hypothetical protein
MYSSVSAVFKVVVAAGAFFLGARTAVFALQKDPKMCILCATPGT